MIRDGRIAKENAKKRSWKKEEKESYIFKIKKSFIFKIENSKLL